MFVQSKFAQDPRTMSFDVKAVAKSEQKFVEFRQQNPLPLSGFGRSSDGFGATGHATGHWGDR